MEPRGTPSDVERRILSAMRRGMRLTCVAWLPPATPSGPFTVGFLDGQIPEDSTAEGRVVGDIGAAAPVLSQRRPLLLTFDRETPVRVPYAASPVPLRGAMVAPVGEGLVWADRDHAPISEEEFAVFCDLCAVLEEERGLRETVLTRDERADYLSRVLEGLQTILSSTSERDCVAALAEAAFAMTRSRAAAVALIGAAHANLGAMVWERAMVAKVVSAIGEGTQSWLGRSFDPTQGLVGVALRSGTSVPSSRRFARSMEGAFGPDIRLPLREGDPILVQPMGTETEPVGALVLAGGQYEAAIATYGVRSLCDAATLLVQRFRLQERISQDAMMDGLTGLLNRKAFVRQVGAAFAFCRRHGHDLSLLMLDADHFKQVNDRYGHLAGDRALQFIAEVIQRGLRESDIAGRYGGEEFAIALPQTGEDGALRVAERIRSQCSASPILLGHHKVSLTVSIGVATMRSAPEGLEGLIAAADEALYAAKRSGRNRVVAAGRT